MPLHLVAMFIHAAKEVRAAMDVQHDPLALSPGLLPPRVMSPHLDPFCLWYSSISSPLPPLASSDSINALMTQLRDQQISRPFHTSFRDYDFVHLYPARTGNPLGSERLEVFDGMMGSV